MQHIIRLLLLLALPVSAFAGTCVEAPYKPLSWIQLSADTCDNELKVRSLEPINAKDREGHDITMNGWDFSPLSSAGRLFYLVRYADSDRRISEESALTDVMDSFKRNRLAQFGTGWYIPSDQRANWGNHAEYPSRRRVAARCSPRA